MSSYYEEALSLFDYTRDLRRDFHRNPELGFQEFRTAGIVAEELKGLGIEVTTGIAETGVVGIIEGAKAGPVVLLRFDMDALPVQEETGAAYASETDGVMHACGHDGHTAIGLATAKALHNHRDAIAGTVKLVFQPAEEGLGGAERMVKEGVLENPRPDYSLALHLWNELEVGQTVVSPGPFLAGAESFSIKVKGKGAHGALPHLGRDPVLAAAHMITALQSIVGRNIDPLEPAVVSITSIHGGTAFNIIPEEVTLLGTVRTFSPEVRERTLARMEAIIAGVAESLDCEAEWVIDEITPPVVNDAELAGRVQRAAKSALPEDALLANYQNMVSEDMAFMMQDIPGCYFFIGSSNREENLDYGHHHPKFDFDEAALPRAVAVMTAAAMSLLDSGEGKE